MSERYWRVGEVAEATGLTVRALHHYDELGLSRPSERTSAGHRLYGDADLRRLHQVVALRSLGVPLDEIKEALERGGHDPRPVLRAQLVRVDRQLSLTASLRRRLARIVDALDAGAAPSINDVIVAIEETTNMEHYYTPEQLVKLEARRAELGPEGMRRVERDWAEAIEALDTERRAGTDPSDPRVQAIAARWRELIAEFTGGDTGIRDALGRMYEAEGAAESSRGAVSEQLAAYARKAMLAAH